MYRVIIAVVLCLVFAGLWTDFMKARQENNNAEAVGVEASEEQQNKNEWQLPEGTEVVIRKGTIGWAYLNQLSKTKDAFRKGDTATARMLLTKNIRQGAVHKFKKSSKAKVDTDMGDYIALIPEGIGLKMYFEREDVEKPLKNSK